MTKIVLSLRVAGPGILFKVQRETNVRKLLTAGSSGNYSPVSLSTGNVFYPDK